MNPCLVLGSVLVPCGILSRRETISLVWCACLVLLNLNKHLHLHHLTLINWTGATGVGFAEGLKSSCHSPSCVLAHADGEEKIRCGEWRTCIITMKNCLNRAFWAAAVPLSYCFWSRIASLTDRNHADCVSWDEVSKMSKEVLNRKWCCCQMRWGLSRNLWWKWDSSFFNFTPVFSLISCAGWRWLSLFQRSQRAFPTDQRARLNLLHHCLVRSEDIDVLVRVILYALVQYMLNLPWRKGSNLMSLSGC